MLLQNPLRLVVKLFDSLLASPTRHNKSRGGEMFKCERYEKDFKSKQALNSHWGLICKPDAKGSKGENNPHFGKKGKNQYTNFDWDSVHFDDLSPSQKDCASLRRQIINAPNAVSQRHAKTVPRFLRLIILTEITQII